MPKLGVVVGSIRDKSWNRKVAEVMSSLFPEDWEAKFIEIKDVPFYDQDWDEPGFTGEIPASVDRLRKDFADVDAYLFVTPEYNRGIPAPLKNALDVISRPPGSFITAHKPALVASVSTGGISGFGANHALRQTLMFLNIPVLAQPELYIGNVHKLFGYDDSEKGGTVPNLEEDKARLSEGTLKWLQGAVDTFVEFAGRWI